MNMIGHPKHVSKCIEAGVDIICAQGGEGGGHTGDVPTSILIPTVVELCKKHKSPLTGKPVMVVAAGGIFNGKSLAASLMMGASAVWVGTRFILADEAGAPKAHQEAVRTAGFDDTIRTIIFTGRPLRVRKNAYIENWETARRDDIQKLTAKGVIPVEHDIERLDELDQLDDETMDNARPFLMGKVAAVVNDKKPAKAIVDEMVAEAVEMLKLGGTLLKAKL
jgi:NAD(P)H-dependent flavin oxidoreductase YrpB (nitropropane dioxygenase family)